jgi:hypothetical protein
MWLGMGGSGEGRGGVLMGGGERHLNVGQAGDLWGREGVQRVTGKKRATLVLLEACGPGADDGAGGGHHDRVMAVMEVLRQPPELHNEVLQLGTSIRTATPCLHPNGTTTSSATTRAYTVQFTAQLTVEFTVQLTPLKHTQSSSQCSSQSSSLCSSDEFTVQLTDEFTVQLTDEFTAQLTVKFTDQLSVQSNSLCSSQPSSQSHRATLIHFLHTPYST